MKPMFYTVMFFALITKHLMKIPLLAAFRRTPKDLIVVFKIDLFGFRRHFTLPRYAVIVEMLATEHQSTFALQGQEVCLVTVFLLAVFSEGRELHIRQPEMDFCMHLRMILKGSYCRCGLVNFL